MKQLLKYKLAFSIFLIWLFHVSGIIGILIGYENWFVGLTPLNLLLCFGVVLWNIEPFSIKEMLILLIPFVIGFYAEYIGVHYGFLFGSYRYGDNLGYKLADIPLMIGINWALLIYASTGLSRYFSVNRYVRIVIASFLMVFLDFFMETTAPRFDFWVFKDGVAPLQNYIGWFLVALIANSCYMFFRPKVNQVLATHLYAVMLIFFVVFYFL
jgi:putative membrane protein